LLNNYVIYLRKSRADLELEAKGEMETLAKHEKALFELAHKMNLPVTAVYKEIVSGETISARPVVQQLIDEVEQGMWTGVLVMEIERLARGDTIDQGIIARAFKIGNTKIITPNKTYDPMNEFDEEYFEFGLFMSRREFKTIRRRMDQGRIASVKEGHWVSNRAPYGYERVKIENGKGFTLAPIESEATIVKMIFDYYVNGITDKNGNNNKIGMTKICNVLNSMGIKPRNTDKWVTATINGIIRNPTYCGKVRWNNRKSVKSVSNGKITKSRPRAKLEDCILADGLHEPIISEELWQKAYDIVSTNKRVSVPGQKTTQNPLVGLVKCGVCGRNLYRRPNTSSPDMLICQAKCGNIGSYLSIIEQRILNALSDWAKDYKLQYNQNDEQSSNIQNTQKALETIETELSNAKKQLNNVYDLLEQGIYDVDTFTARSAALKQRIDEVIQSKASLEKELEIQKKREETKIKFIPKIEHLLEVYNTMESPQAKNELLKEVLEKVEYKKDYGGRWKVQDDFSIRLYPRLPRN